MNTALEIVKTVPFESEAEAMILGAIMRDNSLIGMLSFINETIFYAPLHQRIYTACKAKIDNGELATPVTLMGQFKSDPDALHGRYLIQCCTLAEGSAFEAGALARFIREQAYKRQLLEECEKAQKLIYEEVCDSAYIAHQIASICEKVMAGDKRWEMRKGSQVTQSIVDSMKASVKPFSTGIRRLDEAMDGGLYSGKLYGFAGKKKHGKTILGGTISVNLAVNGVKHLFICGEMSDEEVQQRNLARMGDFFPTAFRNDKGYTESIDFKNRFQNALQWQQDNIIFINAPALTFDKLKHIVKQAVLRHGIKGFILDYWQLVGGKDGKKNMAEHLDDVAQWLADSAKKYQIFAITTAQINQEGNTRGGEGLRLACDQLYQIQRPDLSQPGMWLEMMDTRYTKWANIGDEAIQSLQLNPKGPYFEEFA